MLQYWQGIAPYLLRKNSEQTRSSYGAMPNKNRRVPLRIRCAELRIQNYELKIEDLWWFICSQSLVCSCQTIT